MTFKCKFKNIKKFYKIFIVFVIFFNTILISKLNANSFKINEIEVSEDFNLDFNKEKVFDKAFELAFFQLISTVVLSKDIEIIEKTSLSKTNIMQNLMLILTKKILTIILSQKIFFRQYQKN